MAETCQSCGNEYETVYRVPNDVWSKIAPSPETLGDHREHQYGGLLCLQCADKVARELGIRLYWEATEGTWRLNQEITGKQILNSVNEWLDRLGVPQNEFLAVRLAYAENMFEST